MSEKTICFVNMIKKINLNLIFKGHSTKDKLKVMLSFFFLAPLRKIGITKKEMLITMNSEEGKFICGDKSIPIVSEDYEKNIRKFFDLKEGVFIDIGANLGKYTIMMASRLKRLGSVVSIEPEPHTIELLKQNVKLNKLKNVFVIGKACSSKNGKEILYLEGTTYSGGLHSLKKDCNHVNQMKIDVEKLDSIISRLKIKRVDLIKIDTEGTEFDVLSGAQKILKDFHPKIICECAKIESEKKVRDLLKKFKYYVKRIDKENIFAY